ncbi:Putative multidrug resistance protein MdtD [Oligella ureolytica]
MSKIKAKPSSIPKPQHTGSERAQAVGTEGIPKPQRYWAVIAIILAISVSVMDASIANLALPTISNDLGIPPHQSVWVVNAYLVTLIAMTLPMSALGERIGFVNMFRSGIAIFMFGSVICALSTNLPMLLTGRVINGLGGAVMMSIFGAMMPYLSTQRNSQWYQSQCHGGRNYSGLKSGFGCFYYIDFLLAMDFCHCHSTLYNFTVFFTFFTKGASYYQSL